MDVRDVWNVRDVKICIECVLTNQRFVSQDVLHFFQKGVEYLQSVDV